MIIDLGHGSVLSHPSRDASSRGYGETMPPLRSCQRLRMWVSRSVSVSEDTSILAYESMSMYASLTVSMSVYVCMSLSLRILMYIYHIIISDTY